MRSAVHVNAMIAASEKSISDFRKSAVERQVPGQLDGGLGFIAVGTARAFEFEAAVIRNVDFLVRVIDEEKIGAESEAPEIGRCAELIEVRRCKPRLLRMLHDTACVDTVDATTVVRMERQRHARCRRESDVPFALPAPRVLKPAGIGIHSILDIVTE